MARMNDDGQWIVLMGFIVAISLFFLAIVISESTLVGQTTSEAVLDFSKADIQDLTIKTRDLAIFNNPNINTTPGDNIREDIEKLYGERKGVVINITTQDPGKDQWYRNVTLHYNDGITNYDAYQSGLSHGSLMIDMERGCRFNRDEGVSSLIGYIMITSILVALLIITMLVLNTVMMQEPSDRAQLLRVYGYQ